MVLSKQWECTTTTTSSWLVRWMVPTEQKIQIVSFPSNLNNNHNKPKKQFCNKYIVITSEALWSRSAILWVELSITRVLFTSYPSTKTNFPILSLLSSATVVFAGDKMTYLRVKRLYARPRPLSHYLSIYYQSLFSGGSTAGCKFRTWCDCLPLSYHTTNYCTVSSDKRDIKCNSCLTLWIITITVVVDCLWWVVVWWFASAHFIKCRWFK